MAKKAAEKKVFKHEELETALLDVVDKLGASQLSKNFLLLKETGKALHDDVPLWGDGIDVGIEVKYLIPEAYTVLETHLGMKIDPEANFIEYSVGEVPVRIQVVRRTYGFFQNPNQTLSKNGIYKYADYQVPNPFDIYWKSRFFVK